MFGNYLAVALRNLIRNRLYAGVTIAGLAVGFAAALLIGLYVRDELTYDRFIPGHERVYLFTQTLVLPAARPIESATTPMMLAKPLRADFPEIAEVARLTPSYFPSAVRRGDFTATEQNTYWADPQFFLVLPLPALAGDLVHALEPPDGVVITRAIARKYFGKDAPIGGILQIDGQPMRVTAVLKDLPSNTHLVADIIASARAPQSPITRYEYMNGPLTNTLLTYVRLKPGVSPNSITQRLDQFLVRRLPLTADALVYEGKVVRVGHLVPLTRLHLMRFTQGMVKPAADPAVVAAIGAIGVLIVAVAAMNFVTLMTARGARRAVEVGVRKAAGARRRDLIVQFLSEAALYVVAAGLIAASVAELLMPAVNAFLQRRLVLDYLHDPALVASALAVLLITALLAGSYPAFVLSGFKPSAVLKGGGSAIVGGGRVRQALVIGQFAVLIALTLVAITIARQTVFALNEGMRVDKDQVLLVFSQPCNEGFRDQVGKLPGVRSAACASYQGLNLGDDRVSVGVRGHKIDLAADPVDYGFFEVFGIKPLAGRLFERSRPADGALGDAERYQPVVLNETAVRQLGFASPRAALGKSIVWHGFWDESMRRPEGPVAMPAKPSEIIGVVPDFTLGSVRQPILPTFYAIGRNLPPSSVAMIAKLDGTRVPESLGEIDRLWKRYGDGRPILRVFADRFTMRLYIDTLIQGATVAIAGVIALSIAALGLFALSAYTTERRTKEIGVRKAMGASSSDILRLLLWQFTKPVIWANLIAWPAAFMIMRWWLASFAYHVNLAPWTFLAAGAAALVIAWATVFVHAVNVARAKPVSALRYE
jgi:putative ABC transport system permease protein